jgi:hypothetical protein
MEMLDSIMSGGIVNSAGINGDMPNIILTARKT